MLARLAEREHSVGELAAPFRMTLAAASKHIKTLERAGLVRRDVRGRSHVCALEPAPLAEAEQWLRTYARFWTERLDALETALSAEDAAQAAEVPSAGSPTSTASDARTTTLPEDENPS
jgi:DNA-binding MarR family transcriptional regulator